MPEGHTIHRLARDHARFFAGHPVAVSSPQGRFEAGAAVLDGAVLTATDAYGKHLLHHYDHGAIVHLHLGLFGRVRHHRGTPPEPPDTVRYRVANAVHTIDLIGATACELLDPARLEALTARLGPDPLRADADPDRAYAALQRRRVGVGRALLDQRVVAGVGNVYRAEVLLVHGVHPELPARELGRTRFDGIWDTLRDWMARGVRERRIVTVDRDELGLPPGRIARGGATYVYRQTHCRRCGTPVRRWDLAGRWAYACERCQPPPA